MAMMTFTTAECQRLLPGVLQQYLWKLAEESGAEEQEFVLSAAIYGEGDIQEILHRRNKLSSWHRVFGYDPVEATVEVRITQYGAVMSLRYEEEDDWTELAALFPA